MILWTLGMLEWFAGSWERALDHATAAQNSRSRPCTELGWVGRVKALIEADLGLVEQARASAEEVVACSEADVERVLHHLYARSCSAARARLGNLEAAAGYLRELPGRLLAAGMNDPTAPVWADAIETLIAARRARAGARTISSSYEVHAQRLGSPWALAARCALPGLLAAAEGDSASPSKRSSAPSPSWKGVRIPSSAAAPCSAWARAPAGAAEAGRAGSARAGARDLRGARRSSWAEKARAELKRISGRQPASEELTETERRVADLAAQGRPTRRSPPRSSWA